MIKLINIRFYFILLMLVFFAACRLPQSETIVIQSGQAERLPGVQDGLYEELTGHLRRNEELKYHSSIGEYILHTDRFRVKRLYGHMFLQQQKVYSGSESQYYGLIKVIDDQTFAVLEPSEDQADKRINWFENIATKHGISIEIIEDKSTYYWAASDKGYDYVLHGSRSQIINLYTEAAQKLEHEPELWKTFRLRSAPSASSPVQSQTQAKSSAKSLVRQGNTYRKNKEYNKAIDCFTKAIELDPKNVEAYIKRSRSWLRSREIKDDFERYIKAAQDAIEAHKIAPKSYNASWLYVQLKCPLGQVSGPSTFACIDAFEKVIQLDPTKSGPYVRKISLLKKFDLYSNMINEYNRAIIKIPNNLGFQVSLASLYVRYPETNNKYAQIYQPNPIKAIELAQKVIQSAPNRSPWKVDAFKILAEARAEMGDFEAAIKAQKKFIELIPKHSTSDIESAKTKLELYEKGQR